MIQDPVILAKGRARVKTWLAQNPASRFAREWNRLLENGPETVAAFLIERSEFAEEMRQSTPFAGTLEPRKRWDIWRATRRKLVSQA
jgi:hypothetical protein